MGCVLLWGRICPIGGASVWAQPPRVAGARALSISTTPTQRHLPRLGAESTAEPCIPMVQARFMEHKMPAGL